LSFSHIQRIVRKGEVRVNGKRVDTKDRLADRPAGAHSAAQAQRAASARRFLFPEDEKTRAFLKVDHPARG
jgi:23S rRNA pseudouridine955/2504/2580 synthase